MGRPNWASAPRFIGSRLEFRAGTSLVIGRCSGCDGPVWLRYDDDNRRLTIEHPAECGRWAPEEYGELSIAKVSR